MLLFPDVCVCVVPSLQLSGATRASTPVMTRAEVRALRFTAAVEIVRGLVS